MVGSSPSCDGSSSLAASFASSSAASFGRARFVVLFLLQ